MKTLVKMMLENIHESWFSFSKGRLSKGWNSYLKWFKTSQELRACFAPPCKETPSPSIDKSLFEYNFHMHMKEAQKGISQIQDPLWYRVCADILKVLGPLAFKDIWKTQLLGISSEGKRAFLSCPSQSIAAALEEYHFVVIGALKKFYPSLNSIETKIEATSFKKNDIMGFSSLQ